MPTVPNRSSTVQRAKPSRVHTGIVTGWPPSPRPTDLGARGYARFATSVISWLRALTRRARNGLFYAHADRRRTPGPRDPPRREQLPVARDPDPAARPLRLRERDRAPELERGLRRARAVG